MAIRRARYLEERNCSYRPKLIDFENEVVWKWVAEKGRNSFPRILENPQRNNLSRSYSVHLGMLTK